MIGKTNPAFNTNKRANNSQLKTLAIDASLNRVSSFTTKALLDQTNTIKTLSQKPQTLLKKDFNITADPSESKTLRNELMVDCKLRAKRLRRTLC